MASPPDPSVEEGLHLLIELGTKPAGLSLGDAIMPLACTKWSTERVRGLTNAAISLGIPPIDMNRLDRMTSDERTTVRKLIRDQYAIPQSRPLAQVPPPKSNSLAKPRQPTDNTETDAITAWWACLHL